MVLFLARYRDTLVSIPRSSLVIYRERCAISLPDSIDSSCGELTCYFEPRPQDHRQKCNQVRTMHWLRVTDP